MKFDSVTIAEGCILCGACAEICPEVFAIDRECRVLRGAELDFFGEWIEQACETCPVNVIQITQTASR